MRVITGSARGRVLESVPGYATRPTAGRVKEAMMSVLHFEIPEAVVLDLYAGTGQLGIEALSRGAGSVTFVEQSHPAEAVIRRNLSHTNLEKNARVYTSDVTSWLARSGELFDIVFADPPYDNNTLPEILPAIVARMKETGVIVCESATHDPLPEQTGSFVKGKEYFYGKRKVTVYRKPQD